MKQWSVRDALDLYGFHRWGDGYFGVSSRGTVSVYPTGDPAHSVDLASVVEKTQGPAPQPPILVRFPQILGARVARLRQSFVSAFEATGLAGHYRPLYPIKANLQSRVVEDILHYGRPFDLGLEVGSKAELVAAALMSAKQRLLIVCNGYKDPDYIDCALLTSRLGTEVVIVVEKLRELRIIAEASRRLGIEPKLGIRMRLSSRGVGRWRWSAGDRSKFGLGPEELLEAMSFLRRHGLLCRLELLHFHLGSQIADISCIKTGVREALRYYTELQKMGAALQFFDVGGGLAVDYDGTRSRTGPSTNYAMEEYALAVVTSLAEVFAGNEKEAPVILSESGRALTAHHEVLVFGVLDSTEYGSNLPPPPKRREEKIIASLEEILHGVGEENCQQAYHEALRLKEDSLQRFALGYLNLHERAHAESLFWCICRKILNLLAETDYIPPELRKLETKICDTYSCNVSFFQSLPDAWGVGQIFPVTPLQRLDEEPKRRAILTDITCDSDGRLDRFASLRRSKRALEVHCLESGETYRMAAFLVGAYQESLGTLHNLFGPTAVLEVLVDENGGDLRLRSVPESHVQGLLRLVGFDAKEARQRALEFLLRGQPLGDLEPGLKQVFEQYGKILESSPYLSQVVCPKGRWDRED